MSRIRELEGKVGKMKKASPGSSGKAPSQEVNTANKKTFSDFIEDVVAAA